jgi:hypothetical protein
MVADFLQIKARRSITTGLNLWHALQQFNAYTKSCYKMDLDQIVAALKGEQEKIDVYVLLNSFITYLQKETPNGSDMMPSTVVTYVARAKSYLQYADIDIHSKLIDILISLC